MISCRAFADIAISASLSTPGYAGVLRSTICLVDALELSQKLVVYEDFAGLPRSIFFFHRGVVLSRSRYVARSAGLPLVFSDNRCFI